MSSIDNILSILRKTLEEKKQPLNEQYEITSTWLAKELDIVRKLVQNDPRDMQAIEETMIPDAASSAASSAHNSKKRKSPETASEFKLSPDQKRSSVDVKDLLAAAGLPVDLNKLKKEQLLEELVKRGVTKFNMKNLKNDLIDALESAIVLEKRNSFKVSQEEAASSYENSSPANQQPFVATVASVDEVEASAAAVAVEAAPASAAKPARVRQGSLMAEFRKKVYNTSSQDADVDSKIKIENEFRNRQERHRDSIARKSQILEAPPAQEEAHEDAEEAIQSSSVPFASAAAEPESLAAETAMDIASPIRETVRPAEPEEVEQPEDASDEAPCDAADEAVESMDAAPEATVVEEPQPEPEAEADKEEDDISDIEEDASVSASVAADVLQETTASALSQQSESSAFPQSSKSSLSSTNSGLSHASEPVKKPTNLVNLSNSASSFLDKPATKPMVPALAKAKLLKEQEELKEQKRKELKAAKAAGAMGGSKPAASSAAAAAAAESNSVRSPWGKMAKGIKNVAEDVKSKINLFNKKPATAAETVAAKAPTKQPFDVRATESKASLSAAPPATPAAAAAPSPEAVAPVSAAPPAPVVEASAAAIAAPPAPPAVETAQPTAHVLPPKSAIKEILKNYHDAVASPISTKPAPVISIASLASPVAPVASIPMPAASVLAPVAPAPLAAPVAPVVPSPVVATLQPAEPHVLREQVVVPAQPTVAAPAQAAAVAAQPAAQEEEEDDYDPANNYQIEDTPDSDDSDGGSGTDDEDESNKKKQQVPEWARGDALREALERQYGLNGHALMDPDLIFPEVQSCSLEEIFGRKEGLSRKYSARTSSAHWDADELTLVEKRQYRVHMGYEQNPGASAGGRPVKLH